MRQLAWLLLWLLPLPALAQAELPVLRLTTFDNKGEDNIQIYAASTVRQALSQLGYQLQLEKSPNLQSIAEANDGNYDGELLRIDGINQHFPNLVQVPEPLISTRFLILTRAELAQARSDWRDIGAKRLATVHGYLYFDQLPEPLRTLERVESNTIRQSLHQLATGQAELTVITELYFQLHGLNLQQLSLVELSPALPEFRGYLYLHKRHAALVQPLAQVLRDMRLRAKDRSRPSGQ